MVSRSIAFLLCSLLLFPLLLHAQDDGDEGTSPSDAEPFETRPPRFSHPTRGAGIAFNFGFTGVRPSDLDTNLDGDLVMSGFSIYALASGLVIGGSWNSTVLYDAPDTYDKFNFSYGGLLLGYDHSLFYGKMSVRPSILLGRGNITMIESRPDITGDPTANPDGHEVLERLREQDFYMLRPGFGIGWMPVEFLQFRADAYFMYPTGGGGELDDLRKPVYTFSFVFGPNR